MDLLSISRTVWRHKLATIPVLLIMLVGIAYVLGVKAPLYQAQSSYILLPAATPPTAEKLATDPTLKGVNPNNPFTGYGDLSIVVDLLTEVMTGPAEGQVLANQGLTGPYTVAPLTTAYGNAPIIQITAQGPSPAAATNSATLVGKAFQSQLANIQASQRTSTRYWIGSLELSRPDRAQQQVSSKLRDVVGVIAFGVILLFVMVSTMNAREERKRQWLRAQEGVEEDAPLPRRFAEPELDGLPVESYSADPERVRAVHFVRATPAPDGRVVELEEEWRQSRPGYFDAPPERSPVSPRHGQDG
jgi:hypothetical protein